MAESSVDSYINAQPEQAMSLSQFSAKSNLGTEDYGNWIHKIGNFFTGDVDKMKQEYETYLSNLKNQNEFAAVQSARQWEKYLDDTRIQRAMKDYEKAGLNPYLAINDGAISTGSASGSGAKASYGSPESKEKQSSGKGRDIALLLLAVAKVAAAFL